MPPISKSEKAMATHFSILGWKIPWVDKPGRLQSMGSLRVGHNWAASLSCIGEGNGNPLQCSCLENPRDGGVWWAAIYGVAQSWTWLKRLCSSSSSSMVSPWERDKFKVVDSGLGRRTPKEFASEKPYLFDLGHKGWMHEAYEAWGPVYTGKHTFRTVRREGCFLKKTFTEV